MPKATPKRAGKQSAPGVSPPEEVLARNIRGYRAVRGLSQEELGQRMAALGHGWTAGIVGFVERGDRNVTVGELLGVALVLGVPPGHLLSPAGAAPGLREESLDVGLPDPITQGAAFPWVNNDIVFELRWDNGPAGLGCRRNLHNPGSDETIDHVVEWMNDLDEQRRGQ